MRRASGSRCAAKLLTSSAVGGVRSKPSSDFFMGITPLIPLIYSPFAVPVTVITEFCAKRRPFGRRLFENVQVVAHTGLQRMVLQHPDMAIAVEGLGAHRAVVPGDDVVDQLVQLHREEGMVQGADEIV